MIYYSIFFACLLTVNAFANNDNLGSESVTIHGLTIPVFTYHPDNCQTDGLVIILHGQRRNAAQYRDFARSFAQHNCLVIVAPEFAQERFPNWRYQRGGIIRKGKVYPPEKWTVNVISELAQWARQREGTQNLPYFLFGHSAGAQFLSRVAAFAPPKDVKRIVIANSSSYVAPSLEAAAPYGMGGVFENTLAQIKLQEYLSQPITIYLGDADTGSKSLHNHPAATSQGKNRLERGIHIFRSAAILAQQQHWAFNWRLVIAPKVGHSAKQMLSIKEVQSAFGYQ